MSGARTRRGLLLGALCSALCWGLPAAGAEGVVLVLVGADVPEHEAISAAFSEALPNVTLMSYALDSGEGAGAMIADGLRGLPVAVVFALGDTALRAASREYATAPLVFAEAVGAAEEVAGRDRTWAVQATYDPAAAVRRVQVLVPSARSVGVLRYAPVADDPFLEGLRSAAGDWKVQAADVSDEAGVGSALAVALAQDVVWIAPGAWPAAAVGKILAQARAQARPVIGFRTAHLEADQPACIALLTDPAGVGTAAAAAVAQVLAGGAPAALPPAAPQVFGHQAACRAAGVLLNKTTAAGVDRWVDRKP